jgi:hypothetical protein
MNWPWSKTKKKDNLYSEETTVSVEPKTSCRCEICEKQFERRDMCVIYTNEIKGIQHGVPFYHIDLDIGGGMAFYYFVCQSCTDKLCTEMKKQFIIKARKLLKNGGGRHG